MAMKHWAGGRKCIGVRNKVRRRNRQELEVEWEWKDRTEWKYPQRCVRTALDVIPVADSTQLPGVES